MFLLFTPFSYLYMIIYSLVLLFSLSVSDFYIFWIYMEVLMLIFMGLSFSVFTNSYTQLMLYFLMQTVASFCMLVFYSFNIFLFFYLFFFLKFGMFPFISWYINVLYRFPPFMLFFSSTVHKLPPLYLFSMVFTFSAMPMVVIVSFLSLLAGGILMLSVLDLRYLLVVSSMANGSFLVFSVLGSSLVIFLMFFILYALNTFILLFLVGTLMKMPNLFSRHNTHKWVVLLVFLLNMASMPPLPMFFVKFIVLYQLLSIYSSLYSIVLLIVVINIFLMASYCLLFTKMLVNRFDLPTFILLY